MQRKSLLAGALCTAALVGASATAAFAGEITGNGTLKQVNGNSPCAFSGQEDLQWYTTDADDVPVANPIKGVPAHSQNWGHTKQALGLTGGANSTALDWGCNARDFGMKP